MAEKFCLLLALLAFAGCGDGTVESKPARREPVLRREAATPSSSRFNVVFKNGAVGESAAVSRARLLADSKVKRIAVISDINLSAGNAKPTTPGFGLGTALKPWDGVRFAGPRGTLATVTFADDASAQQQIAEWDQAGTIWFAEPDFLSRFSDEPPFALDAYREEASYWWLQRINLISALEGLASRLALSKTQVQRPVVAVFDSGIDYKHPALVDHIWRNPNPSSHVCPDDLNGCNTSDPASGTIGSGTNLFPFDTTGPGQECPSDTDGSCLHGTHVAGIIAGDAAAGVPGICPLCQLMVVKVVESIGGEGRVSDSAILRGLKYVSQFYKGDKNLVRVVNLSFGKFEHSRSVALFLSELKETRDGVIVVAAAGNEDSEQKVYPAANPDVLGVAAIDQSGRKATYSNFGPWVAIAAPGGSGKERRGGIISSVPGGGTMFNQGTSMAAPMVSGVAGLLLAAEPDLSIDALRSRLVDTANGQLYDPNVAKGYNRTYYYPSVGGEHLPLLGRGLLDVEAALRGQRVSPIAQPGKRVHSNCAMIAGEEMGAKSPWVMYILFMIPIAFALTIRRRRVHGHGETRSHPFHI